MPISATGGAEAAPRAERGFTLVELLVVLTIIGLLAGAVALTMPDERPDLREEAERFAARARAAQELALVEARPVAVRVSASGYAFEGREQGEWRPLRHEALAADQWSDATRAQVPAEGLRILFDPTGVGDPATVTIEREDERLAIAIRHDGSIAIDG